MIKSTRLPGSSFSAQYCCGAAHRARDDRLSQGQPDAGAERVPGRSHMKAGESLQVQPYADDADGDSLAFEIENQPGWTTFDENNGALTGIPDEADVGTYDKIQISVTDGKHLVQGPAFRVVVEAQPAATTPPAAGRAATPGRTAPAGRAAAAAASTVEQPATDFGHAGHGGHGRAALLVPALGLRSGWTDAVLQHREQADLGGIQRQHRPACRNASDWQRRHVLQHRHQRIGRRGWGQPAGLRYRGGEGQSRADDVGQPADNGTRGQAVQFPASGIRCRW